MAINGGIHQQFEHGNIRLIHHNTDETGRQWWRLERRQTGCRVYEPTMINLERLKALLLQWHSEPMDFDIENPTDDGCDLYFPDRASADNTIRAILSNI